MVPVSSLSSHTDHRRTQFGNCHRKQHISRSDRMHRSELSCTCLLLILFSALGCANATKRVITDERLEIEVLEAQSVYTVSQPIRGRFRMLYRFPVGTYRAAFEDDKAVYYLPPTPIISPGGPTDWHIYLVVPKPDETDQRQRLWVSSEGNGPGTFLETNVAYIAAAN